MLNNILICLILGLIIQEKVAFSQVTSHSSMKSERRQVQILPEKVENKCPCSQRGLSCSSHQRFSCREKPIGIRHVMESISLTTNIKR